MKKKFLFVLLSSFFSIVSYANCVVSASPINFGIYNPIRNEEGFTSSTFAVNCEGTQTTYTMKLLPEAGARVRDRQLNNTKAGSKDVLTYNLFLDSARNIYFGDGTSGTSFFTGSAVSVPIYARIAPRQKVGIGFYTNTVNFEVSF